MAEKDLNPAERYGRNPIPSYAALFALFMLILIAGSALYPDLISTVFYQTAGKLAHSEATVKKTVKNTHVSEKKIVSSEKKPLSSEPRDNDVTIKKAPVTDSAATKVVPVKDSASSIAKVEQAPPEEPSIPHASKKEKVTEVPNALSEFLAYYNLSAYENTFFTAMKTNRFKDITDRIYEETGYQLVLLDQLPEKVKNDYAVLDFISSKAGNMPAKRPAPPGITYSAFRLPSSSSRARLN